MTTDLDIARSVTPRPIADVAAELGLAENELRAYGTDIAKISPDVLNGSPRRSARGRLVLVSAITPTAAGEGKTTTSIGLAQAMARIGESACLALREPSLGPALGRKGGATGGGHSQIIPSDRINLHFTGDFHAIAAAHNLLAALLDNHVYFGNRLQIDPRRILWRRTLDMNDRALRGTIVGLGGRLQGVPRETGFDITPASEVMAILCLAEDSDDLRARLERILVGFTYDGEPVTAASLEGAGAMLALLQDALWPNLVQTLEGTPALIHGGPFANIAHGCNSVLATRMALHLSDWAITEAGFGFDLGAEKFFDIKCRAAGLDTAAVVLVATIRALKLHGGHDIGDLETPDPPAVERGLANLEKHVESIRHFGEVPIVALNGFATDTADEIAVVRRRCEALGVPFAVSEHHARGGEGAIELARVLVAHAKTGMIGAWADGPDGGAARIYDQTTATTPVDTERGQLLSWDGVVNNLSTRPSTGSRYVGLAGPGDKFEAYRSLPQSAGAMAANDGDNVLWMSAAWHYPAQDFGAHVGLALTTDSFRDRAQKLDTTGSHGSGAGNGIGVGRSILSGSNANWDNLSPMVFDAGDVVVETVGGSLSGSKDNIVILKFVFGESDTVLAHSFTEDEVMTEAAFDANAVSVSGTVDEALLDLVTFDQNRGQNAIDELRIGDTFVDVTTGTTDVPREPLEVTDIFYHPGSDEITLTWKSNPGEIYGIQWSPDLATFYPDVNQSIPAHRSEPEATFGPFASPAPGAECLILRVGPPDTIAPTLLSMGGADDEVVLTYSEPMLPGTATDPANYFPREDRRGRRHDPLGRDRHQSQHRGPDPWVLPRGGRQLHRDGQQCHRPGGSSRSPPVAKLDSPPGVVRSSTSSWPPTETTSTILKSCWMRTEIPRTGSRFSTRPPRR